MVTANGPKMYCSQEERRPQELNVARKWVTWHKVTDTSYMVNQTASFSRDLSDTAGTALQEVCVRADANVALQQLEPRRRNIQIGLAKWKVTKNLILTTPILIQRWRHHLDVIFPPQT